MNKRKFLFWVMVLLFGFQLIGCAWEDRDYQGREWDYGQHKYDKLGRDKNGFPRGQTH